MLTTDRLQKQRFERKYFITETQARAVREFVRSYLEPDEFSSAAGDFSYPVHSIYLDSMDLATYWATVHCEKSRFKLRVRFYDEDPRSPVFFEIKRRMNECILKQRAAVQRVAAPILLAGHLPEPGHLFSPKPAHLVAVQRFCYLMQQLGARPLMHVAYQREAWVSQGHNSVRVTVDRQVRGEEWREARFTQRLDHAVAPFGERRILELKFTDRFPDWFRDLVEHFNLTQCGVPKYCGCIGLAGEEALSNPRGLRPALMKFF